MAGCKVADLASRPPARPRHSSSLVHSQLYITSKQPNVQMKQKYNKSTDKFEDFLRPRSRQRVLATPERSRGSTREPAATHDQEMSTAPPAMLPRSRESIVSPQPEHTSNVAEAYTQPPFEPSTRAIVESIGAQVAEITQDVKQFRTQRQEVDNEKLMKKHEKAIITGEALLSLCSFGRIAYTLWPSQSGSPRRQASSITTATPPQLRATGRL